MSTHCLPHGLVSASLLPRLSKRQIQISKEAGREVQWGGSEEEGGGGGDWREGPNLSSAPWLLGWWNSLLTGRLVNLAYLTCDLELSRTEIAISRAKTNKNLYLINTVTTREIEHEDGSVHNSCSQTINEQKTRNHWQETMSSCPSQRDPNWNKLVGYPCLTFLYHLDGSGQESLSKRKSGEQQADSRATIRFKGARWPKWHVPRARTHSNTSTTVYTKHVSLTGFYIYPVWSVLLNRWYPGDSRCKYQWQLKRMTANSFTSVGAVNISVIWVRLPRSVSAVCGTSGKTLSSSLKENILLQTSAHRLHCLCEKSCL